MNYLGRVINNCKYIYNEINAATLTGAIDVIVVEQPDGTFTCSPFHVRFGKMGVLRSKEKIVDIEINGEPVDIHMKLGESGEAFFVEEVEVGDGEDESIPPHLACSPIPPEGERFPSDWRLEEGDNIPIPGDINHSSSTPKTFLAETVDKDIVRKLSTSDFRPIPIQQSQSSTSSQESTSEFTKEDSPSADERVDPNPIGQLSTSNSNNNKRRRKKKSAKKKGQKRASINQQTLCEDKEGIFQIEDLDNQQPQPQPPKKDNGDIQRDVEAETKDMSSAQQLERDIHFFSDTEITPGSSPRDFTPVQSDSEIEKSRNSGVENIPVNNTEEQPHSWKWGELPNLPNVENDNKQESQKWMLHNMLGFMKKTKHLRHKNETEGIYLSELNSDDPEMAALYFPSNYKQTVLPNSNEYTEIHEEDRESGNGPSLPHSPHSIEGAICGPKSLDHFEKYPDDVALSLCGMNGTNEQFQENLLLFEDLCLDPMGHLNNPKLVMRMNGTMYSWRAAAPMILSMFIFHKGLPQEVVAKLNSEEPLEEGIVIGKDVDSKQPKKPYSSWFTWSSRSNQKMSDITSVDKIEEQMKNLELVEGKEVTDDKDVKDDKDIKEEKQVDELDNKSMYAPPKRPDSIFELQPGAQDVPLDLSLPRSINKTITVSSPVDVQGKRLDAETPDYNPDKYRKTLRLSSEQIANLKLQPGANEIVFSVTTAYQGTSKCSCYLFCWRYDDKVVISDIDGTITKSDVLGHILPIMGKDWAQSGVAKLFTKIKDNGYKLLYLSARAIGQSRLTREYLKSIKQEDLGLPEGPLLLNPTSLLNAFHTEVIEKKPEEFKISCLKDIQALFPSYIKPFYAGYGNKINDVWAYQAVGVPIFRIFTINHRGELKHELTQTFQSSYTNMSALVDQMFPSNKPLSSNEDFSQFVYWREPIQDITTIDLNILEV